MTVVGESAPADKGQKAAENSNAVFENMESPSDTGTGGDSDQVIQSTKLPGGVKSGLGNKMAINRDLYTKDELTISSDEKQAFVDALLENRRYKSSVKLLGGRLSVVIRSRTKDETDAMFAFLRHEILGSGKTSDTLIDRMAKLLLVAQIEEVNGTKFPEMKSPYTYTQSEGKEADPGWLVDLVNWEGKPEGLTATLINQIQLFEYKYWTMVEKASDANFWAPGTSTEV